MEKKNDSRRKSGVSRKTSSSSSGRRAPQKKRTTQTKRSTQTKSAPQKKRTVRRSGTAGNRRRTSGRRSNLPAVRSTGIRGAIGRWIRQNRLKSLIILLCLILIVFLLILHSFDHEKISSGGYTHASRFSNDLVVDGIDVSYAQGDSIDWDTVKDSGVDFVFIRAGYRDTSKGRLYEDSKFEQNIKGAEDAGLMVGVYFYSQALSAKEARAEAKYLVQLVSDQDVQLPLVMDYELYTGGRLSNAINSGKLDSAGLYNAADTFCSTVEKAGYESMVYSNYDFLMHYIDGSYLGQRTNIWLAHYASQTDYPYAYSFWQCSSESTVPGISGKVDRDFWYIDPDSTYYTLTTGSAKRKSISKCSVELSDHSSRYMGFAVEPGVDVYDGSTKLDEGTDYTVSYLKNTGPGTGYAVVTGKGGYKDSIVTSFKIKKFL
jgi:GH25 family lysozyme M1 (1,4-beta-N-acetylmuramidase)